MTKKKKTVKKRSARPKGPKLSNVHLEAKKIDNLIAAEGKGLMSVAPQPNLPAVQKVLSEAEILEAFDLLGITTKLDDRTKRLFVAVAKASNLNPLRREIHAVERKQKVTSIVPGKGEVTEYVKVLTPVTGFEVFIDRAEMSGRLGYWNVATVGSVKAKDLTATVTIKRKDWAKEFTWTVRWEEVSAENPMWQKEPTHMTEKVAISRAFRLCFRDILRDMPYTVEEEASIREEEEVAMPSAVKGVVTDVEGRVVEEKKSAAPKLPTLEEMKVALTDMYTKAAQVYNIDGTPKLDGEGRPIKRVADDVPHVMLFNPDELKKMISDASVAKANVSAMMALSAQWKNQIAERIAAITIKEAGN